MTNFYNTNMQNLLHLAKELHTKGFGKLKVTPSVSPSGMSWRCEFYCGKKEVIASSWITSICDITEKEIPATELIQLFERQHTDFLKACKGTNTPYIAWFADMINSLQPEELPYASADYFPETDHWLTTKGRKIYISKE